MKTNVKHAKKSIIIAAIILIAVIALAFSMMVEVPTGHTGVVVTFGKTEDYVLNEGLHVVLPWQTVVKMDNRAQKTSTTLDAFSSDIQQVQVQVAVNFSINSETSQNLYKNVGKFYYDTVMTPRIFENTKSVFSEWTAEDLVSNRSQLSDQIMSLLTPEMNAYGINIISVSVEDIDFTDVFTDAVEAKQVAEQSKLQAEIEEKQKTMVAEQEAQRAEIQANASASVAKIEADAEAYAIKVAAEAEAEANRLVAESLTSDLIKYNEVMNWNGQLPQVYASDGTVPILNITSSETTSAE